MIFYLFICIFIYFWVNIQLIYKWEERVFLFDVMFHNNWKRIILINKFEATNYCLFILITYKFVHLMISLICNIVSCYITIHWAFVKTRALLFVICCNTLAHCFVIFITFLTLRSNVQSDYIKKVLFLIKVTF